MGWKLTLPAVALCALALGPALANGTDEQTEAEAETSAEAAPEAPALTADIEAGQKLYRRECRGCHGPTAKGLASYPRLVGQPADYLTMRLEQYRAGEKLGPNTPLMAPRARTLSDQDIANLAGFITSLDG